MTNSSHKKLSVLRSEIQLGFDFSFDVDLELSDRPTTLRSIGRKVVPFPAPNVAKPLPAEPAKRGRGRPAEVNSNDYHWTKEDIISMRVHLLVTTLDSLADPRINHEEMLEWIKSDELGPFTFYVCCSAAELDPDDLRDALLSNVEDAPWFHSDYL
ncbi:hypothetical protein ACT3UJ_07035 [Halomonas sp. 86]|uniref:hypothetical protein n=1 Tax=unclassified Halomonas TaxID=2609666 RepID=UPI004033D0A0